MTDPIIALIAKIETGNRISYDDTDKICAKLIPGATLTDLHMFKTACEGQSIDAVLALHKAVCPDLGWEVSWLAKYPHMIPGGSGKSFSARIGWGSQTIGHDDDPARALLLAILRAMQGDK